MARARDGRLRFEKEKMDTERICRFETVEEVSDSERPIVEGLSNTSRTDLHAKCLRSETKYTMHNSRIATVVSSGRLGCYDVFQFFSSSVASLFCRVLDGREGIGSACNE